MEWVRSCYASEWNLFPNLPGVLTPGRFVFTPDDIPCFPGETNLWSRDWTSDDERGEQTLGEPRDARRSYSYGSTPNPFPDAEVIGTEACLKNGEPPDSGIHLWNPPCFLGATFISQEGNPLEGRDNPTFRQGNSWVMLATDANRQRYVVRVSWPYGGSDPNDLRATAECNGITNGPFAPSVPCVCSDGIVQFDFPAFDPPAVPGTMAFWVVPGPATPVLPTNNQPWMNGFPQACFLPRLPPAVLLPFIPDIMVREVQYEFAQILELQYDDNAQAVARVQAYFGPTAVVTSVANSASSIPGSIICVTPELTVVFVSGTSNFQQWATQFAYAGVGLISLDGYATSGQWRLAKNAIETRILGTTSNPLKPVIFVGHSYGGAVASLLALEWKRGRPDRYVQLFTEGCPFVGDARATALLQPVRRVHLANDGDIVTGVPPPFVEIVGRLAFMPTNLVTQWATSNPNGRQFVLRHTGEIEESDASVIAFTDLIVIINTIVAVLPLPPYAAHSSSTYRARLGLNQP